MEKNIKERKITFEKIFLTVIIMSFITVATYVIMAVITHFSLNYLTDNYNFLQSLISVFDISTAIFKFFSAFMIMFVATIFIAIFIKLAKKQIG